MISIWRSRYRRWLDWPTWAIPEGRKCRRRAKLGNPWQRATRLLRSPTFLSSTRTQILYIASVGLDHWLRFRRDRFDQSAKTPNHSGVWVRIWVWILVQVQFGSVVVLGLVRVFGEDEFKEIHYSQLLVPISY